MFLSRFGVKNYKCLGDIGIPLTPVHVLIGPNDAGKTSLMEAIAALCGSLKRPAKEFFPKPWKGRELVRFDAKELAVEVTGEWASAPIGHAATKPAGGSATALLSVSSNPGTRAPSRIDGWKRTQLATLEGHSVPAFAGPAATSRTVQNSLDCRRAGRNSKDV